MAVNMMMKNASATARVRPSLAASNRSAMIARPMASPLRASEEPGTSTSAPAPVEAQAPAPQVVPSGRAAALAMPSINDVMGFSGAPEIINGRLAMLGFVAAVGAELASGESVLRQWAEEPTGINITFLLFIAASLIPAFMRKNNESLGPFTPAAEMLNGRAAMIGFAALLAVEAARGGAALF